MERNEIFPPHLIDRFKEEGFQRVIEEERKEFERELEIEDDEEVRECVKANVLGVSVYSKEMEHDVKCGCCNWETSTLYSLSTNNVDTEGHCSHCFLEMIIENGWKITGVDK